MWAGQPSLRRLERLGGDTRAADGRPVKALPASTTSYVLSGKGGTRLPRMIFVERYVASCLAACGEPVPRGSRYLRRWLDAWRALAAPGSTPDVAPTDVAAAGEEEALRQLPMDIAEFIGRTAELDRLHAMATTAAAGTGAPTVVAIEGMAGVGKTRLAVRAAHQLVDRGLFADLQLWADLHGFDPARPAADPAAVLDTFLRLLGVPAERIPPDAEGRAALYRDRLAGREAVVLLDNVAGAEQVRPLLPATAGCLVLMTSRRSLAAADGVETLRLEVLTRDEAVALLTRVAGPDRFRDDPGSAARLAELCGHLPIALGVAARRLRSRPAWTPAHLVARLDRIAVRGERVHASFALSYRELGPAARRMFRLLGLHPGADATAGSAAALAGVAADEAEALLDVLLDEHLLQETTPDRYHLHDLLREYAIGRAHAEEPPQELRAAVHRTLTWYLHAADAAVQLLAPHRRRKFPLEPAAHPPPALGGHEQALAWCEAEHATLVAAVHLAAEHGMHAVAWQLPAVLLHYFYLRSHWDDWIGTHTAGLAAARALGDPYGRAQILNGLGVAHSDRRRFPEAVDCYRQALDLFTTVGDTHGQAWTRNNLGVAQVDLGRLTDAVEQFTGALALHRANAEPAGEAICLNNLGDAHRRLGDPERAAGYLREALAIQERTGDRSGRRFTLHTLADLHRDRHDHEQAVRYYERTVTLSRELGDQWGVARALDHLASTLDEMGRTGAARDCRREALDVLVALGRPEAEEIRARLTTRAGPVR